MRTEKKLQNKILNYARSKKMFAHKIESMSANGMPDIIIIQKLKTPILVNYKINFFELKKSSTARKSVEQMKIVDELKNLGVDCSFEYNFDAIIKKLSF